MPAVILLLALLAASVVAQDSLTIITRPPPSLPTATIITRPLPSLPTATIITIPPPNPVCVPHFAAADDPRTADDLDSGRISVPEARKRFVIPPPPPPNRRCEDGPVTVIHTVPGEFHWPPIRKGSCDNLFCKDPPCLPKRQVWRTKCVLVFKLIHGRWVKIGFRIRRFLDHLSCECRTCKHIRTREKCIKTFPCPNSYNVCSFCYWIPFFTLAAADAETAPSTELGPTASADLVAPVPFPFGRCACCTPTCCPAPKRFNYDRCRCECPRIHCPHGQFQNPTTCKCQCPQGSRPDANGRCIGDCKDIDLAWCPKVYCADNPHFSCKKVGHKCTCPSCDASTDPIWCARTKCIEQPMKPMCVTDRYTKRCRCPRCEDQTDQIWCLKTSCGPYNNIRCRWEQAWTRCFCPP